MKLYKDSVISECIMDDIIDDIVNREYAVIIQKHVRGYLIRINLLKLKDGMTFSKLVECINKYNEGIVFIQNMNKTMNQKKIRNENFPSHISENIAKFVISKKYNIMPNWDCKGDLVIINKQLEIKGFMSSGPLSFGPKEPWDIIYFVDGCDTLNKNYKVYEIKLTNISDKWRNIKISGNDTSYEDCIIPDNLNSLKKKN